MAQYEFTHYLHETGQVDEVEDWLTGTQGLPADIAKEIAEQRPFYEIELSCVYDTESRKVTVRSTSL